MGAQRQDIQNYFSQGAGLPASADLAELVEKYPYAAILHFIYLRSLQEEDSYKFPAQLHRTAISTMNRQALLDWAEAPLIPIEVQAAAWQQKQSEPKESVQSTPEKSEVAPKTSAQPLESTILDSVKLPKEPLQLEKQKEASGVAVLRAQDPIPEIPKVEAAEKVPVSTQAKSKPAAQTKLSDINLDALPPAVRAQVLRSRAIQVQLGKTSKAKSDIVEVKPLSQPNPLPDSQALPEDGNVPVQVVENEVLTPLAEVKKVPLIEPLKSASKTPSQEVKAKEQFTEITPPKKNKTRKAKVSQEKKSKRLEASPPTSVIDPTISPFANFLIGLQSTGPKEAMQAVPLSERDPAMERAILEQFLQVNPKIKPVRDAPMGENLALRTPNVSGLVTETLANHYYDQGMTEKAIQAYEILKLKVPEKSAIFAARILQMRKTQSSTK